MNESVPAVPPVARELLIARQRATIVLRGSGRLVAWLGPAIRGITALRHRAAHCRQPADSWKTTWRYCRACPHMAECDYGLDFEPDATTAAGTIHDAPRPLVLAPEFPSVREAEPGLGFALEIVAVGEVAARTLPGVIEALTVAGRLDGLGPDRVRFDVRTEGGASTLRFPAAVLPKAAFPEPVVRDVTIRLDGPLFLRERSGGGGRRQIEKPSLSHLLKASMRAAGEFLGEAAACPGRGQLDLVDLASTIDAAGSDIRPFVQEKASHRSLERFVVEGVTGSWTFSALPVCLIPWLHLGGLLHVGGHRIAGAGGWRMEIGRPEADAQR